MKSSLNSAALINKSDQERRELRTIFVDSGHKTLNALLVVCGGAVVVFLTFLGAVVKDATVVSQIGQLAINGFTKALQFFVSAVALCILTYALTYISHASFHLKQRTVGRLLMAVALIIGLSAVVALVSGSYFAIDALETSLKDIKRTGKP